MLRYSKCASLHSSPITKKIKVKAVRLKVAEGVMMVRAASSLRKATRRLSNTDRQMAPINPSSKVGTVGVVVQVEADTSTKAAWWVV